MDSFRERIDSIVMDRLSGSSELLNQAIGTIFENRNNLNVNELNWIFTELQKIDQAMATIHHFVQEMLPKLPKSDNEIALFFDHFERYIRRWSTVENQLVGFFRQSFNLDQKTILSHSRSSTVLKVLQDFREADFNIIQTVSIPGEEGIIQADLFKKMRFHTELIADDSVANKIESIDLCLLGCDQYSNEAFVNKVGTKEIVDQAKSNNLGVIVFSDSRKYVNTLTSVSEMFEVTPFAPHIYLITEGGIQTFH